MPINFLSNDQSINRLPSSNSVSLCCNCLLNAKYCSKHFFLNIRIPVFSLPVKHFLIMIWISTNNGYQSKTCVPLFFKFKMSICTWLCRTFWNHFYETLRARFRCGTKNWVGGLQWLNVYCILETTNSYVIDDKNVFNEVMWRVASQLISNPGLYQHWYQSNLSD